MARGKEAVLTAPLLADSQLTRQIELERECLTQGVMAYHESVARINEAGEGSRLKAADPLFDRWYGPVSDAIRQDLRHVVRKKNNDKEAVGVHYWGPVLLHFGPSRADIMAAVALHETVSMCLKFPDGVRVASLAYNIGRDLMAHQMLDMAKETAGEQLQALKEKYRDITAQLVFRWGKKTLTENTDWQRKFCTHAGARLLWHVVCNCDCSHEGEEFVLSFHHERRPVRQGGGRIVQPQFIRIDDRVMDMIERNHARRAESRPRYTFMLVEPMPWTPKAGGNYVRHKTSIFTRSSREQQEHAAAGDMTRVYESLNAVNATPSRINLWILGVQQEWWSRGGGVLGIPRALDFDLPTREGKIPAQELKQLRSERWKVRSANRQLKAERILFMRMLGVAEQFANEPRFWEPHLLDYRGRFYARPLYLNHNEDDLRRGLLEFANRKPPGDEGERWLRVQAASRYGVDKVSFDAREEWTAAHADEMERSVRDPMAEEFWRHAEDPWQFLAACRALFDEEAACHLPVDQDGSCNGLQHYTAMGRDEIAAPLVNLCDAPAPDDIYQAVADAIRPALNRDAAESDRIIRYSVWKETGKEKREKPVREIAGELLGVLDRKLVKQPVMTSVYGVTTAGAREQLIARFSEMGFDRQARYEGATYLSLVILKGIGELCSAASKIMQWITRCARDIAREGKPVTWTSPIGLPVLQSYRRYGQYRVYSLAGEIHMLHETKEAPIAVGRQTDGAAPNFVHSVDASHALMTALRCRHRKIDFRANHDSFQTHAATKTDQGRLLRKTFVELHSGPILENLHREFQAQTAVELPPPPPPGTFDLRKVMKSTYAFH